MRVHVDWTRCDGHGACAELLPELLSTDEWGFPIVTGAAREADVPAALERHARRAVKACPLQALRLVD
jgi:ferredoxin